MRAILDDVRDAVRVLRKQPRFLLIAALTLALGIGAVTSIFSVVNGVLLKPLPHPHADRLVSIASTAPGLGYDRFPLSPDLFMFYQRHASAFDDMALFQRRRANLTQTGSPEVVDLLVTTHRFFTTVGAGFPLGRSVRGRGGPARGGEGGRHQPSPLDAEVRRRSQRARPCDSRRRRTVSGGRCRARLARPGQLSRSLDADAVQHDQPACGQLRLERHRAAEGARPGGSGPGQPRAARPARDAGDRSRATTTAPSSRKAAIVLPSAR